MPTNHKTMYQLIGMHRWSIVQASKHGIYGCGSKNSWVRVAVTDQGQPKILRQTIETDNKRREENKLWPAARLADHNKQQRVELINNKPPTKDDSVAVTAVQRRKGHRALNM